MGFLVKTDNKEIVAMEHFPYIFRIVQLPSAFRYEKWFRDRGKGID
jgi:hypothetical protein